MNANEVLGILIYANELDGRHSPNEAKVLAWQEVINSEAHAMTARFARETIAKHYAATDSMLSPSLLVKAWREHERNASDARVAKEGASETHCGRSGCSCGHDGDCFKGWVDSDVTAPCPVCRPTLANAIYAMPSPGSRSSHDWAALRSRSWGV